MFRVKTGLPNESDIVLCTVTKIHYHSVFVKLNEFQDLSGMIHISEISPGRIRNLNDYVKEGKVIVCKVLRVNAERRQIDLSLRRVSESQRRQKINDIKQETIAEKIVEFVATKSKKDASKLYRDITKKVFSDYDSLYSFFEDYVLGEASLENYVPGDVVGKLDEVIRQRIKEPEVEIKGEITIESYDPEGVEVVKSALNSGIKVNPEQIDISYLGAGRFKMLINAGDYPEAESILKKTNKAIEKKIGKKGRFEFQRKE